jgi:KRAB domain-containing zinc finger protein
LQKIYGSHGVGRKFWCKECKKLRTSIKKNQIRKKELCQECGKNVTHLKHHILCVHTVENVKCPKCEKVFKNPMLLKAHTDNLHEKVPCADCGKLIGVQCLRDHMLRVHTDETVKCSICEKMLKNSTVLKAHNKTVHDEKVPCVHCGKLYGVAARMSVHIQAQHTPNEDKKHKREVCGKGFSASDRLKDHNNIHNGEKPYKCKFCSFCFASKGTHAMHERSHLGRGRKNTKK